VEGPGTSAMRLESRVSSEGHDSATCGYPAFAQSLVRSFNGRVCARSHRKQLGPAVGKCHHVVTFCKKKSKSERQRQCLDVVAFLA